MENKDLIIILRSKWSELYDDAKKGYILTTEYSKRRRHYENIIRELEIKTLKSKENESK